MHHPNSPRPPLLPSFEWLQQLSGRAVRMRHLIMPTSALCCCDDGAHAGVKGAGLDRLHTRLRVLSDALADLTSLKQRHTHLTHGVERVQRDIDVSQVEALEHLQPGSQLSASELTQSRHLAAQVTMSHRAHVLVLRRWLLNNQDEPGAGVAEIPTLGHTVKQPLRPPGDRERDICHAYPYTLKSSVGYSMPR